jgi:mannose-6-phosphate isomerase
MASHESIYKLKCTCNQYPWGNVGSHSRSAKLCAKQPGYDNQENVDKDFVIDENSPYAEMWMGTYPVLPSYVADTGEMLQDVIDKYPEQLVGRSVMDRFGHAKLPFLPKVLSIAKALPLQLHPNKDLAAKLHEQNPDQFTDPNHKPEIALALGKFEAFCGFKPLARIERLMQLEPLKKYLPQITKYSFDDQQLKSIVNTMLHANDETVKATYKALTSIAKDKYGPEDDYIPDLAPRLANQYSESDPGLLVALITMNFLVLQAGESIYIPADGIHAYLSGDIIECMARSNNVLNTGFCPRAERDNVDLFTSCLTFTPHSPEECLLKRQEYKRSKNGKTVAFSPPMSEFDALETRLKGGEKEVLGAVKGPSIILATEGGGKLEASGKLVNLTEGQCYFVAQGVELELEAGSDGLLMHSFFVE